MGMKPRKKPVRWDGHLYAVQIAGPGGWEFGPPLYGQDVATGIIGGNFTGSLERAQEERDRLVTHDHRDPKNVRVIKLAYLGVVPWA